MLRAYLLNTTGNTNDETLCFLDNTIEDIGTADVALYDGKPLAAHFPKDARIFMNEENPGVKLSALLGSSRNMIVANGELRGLVEKHCGAAVEYLPFTLYDHRKRPCSSDYCILNPLGTHACLDLQASEILYDKDDPRRVIRILRHVVDREKLAGLPQLFRLDLNPLAYILQYDLAKEMKDRSLTNVSWKKLPFAGE